ncbi:MAG: hypothetical protein ABIY55_18810, partial [Kofleriaceae bacterium]
MTTKTILRASAILGWLLAACSEPAAPSTPDIVPPPLAVRTDAASAAECAFGGSVVRTGLDDDRDGALEDSEATSRSVVCNPAPTPLPPVILVRLAAEKPGASCGAGGTAVQSGPDLNGNGVLDDDEVAHIDYACGQALFTRLAIEPAGPNCSIGGVAFFAGRDRDGDGVLEDAEVETRHFECGDVVASDVTISSDADVAALADVRIISGTVQAQFASLSEISLAKLEHVGGGFRILDSLGRRPIRIALPQLQEVDGAFEVRGSLGEIACPQLRRVGSLTLDSTGLTDVRGFPALATVDGDVTIEFNDLLVSADLPRISVGGDVAIDFNDQLASLTWNLQGRVGNVSIQDNAKLASIDLAVADGLGVPSQIGHITVFGEDAMNRLAVSAARADGLSVNFNAQITDLAVDVATFDGDLTIFGIATPFHLDLTPFRADRIAIAGRLLVSSPLQSIALAAPLTVGDLCVFDATQLTRFDPGSPLTVRGGVRFSANPQLTSIVPIAMLPRASLQVISNAVLP